jgi:hypothetical protein
LRLTMVGFCAAAGVGAGVQAVRRRLKATKILPGTGRWTRSGRRGRVLSFNATLAGERPAPPSAL